jgi:hypothetical protein
VPRRARHDEIVEGRERRRDQHHHHERKRGPWNSALAWRRCRSLGLLLLALAHDLVGLGLQRCFRSGGLKRRSLFLRATLLAPQHPALAIFLCRRLGRVSSRLLGQPLLTPGFDPLGVRLHRRCRRWLVGQIGANVLERSLFKAGEVIVGRRCGRSRGLDARILRGAQTLRHFAGNLPRHRRHIAHHLPERSVLCAGRLQHRLLDGRGC